MLVCKIVWLTGGRATFQYTNIYLKKSPQKSLAQLQNNFTEKFLWWPFMKFLKAMLVHEKDLIVGQDFTIRLYGKH